MTEHTRAGAGKSRAVPIPCTGCGHAMHGLPRCGEPTMQADGLHPCGCTVAMNTRRDAARLDPTGRYIESSLHGPDGWCGETRPHTHGLSEGIITYTDGHPADWDESEWDDESRCAARLVRIGAGSIRCALGVWHGGTHESEHGEEWGWGRP